MCDSGSSNPAGFSDWVTDDEEEIVVKLSGTIPDELLSRMSTESQPKCSYMDLDKSEPLLQLGGDLFKGKFSFCSGTNIILEEKDNQSAKTSHSSTSNPGSKSLEFHSVTDKQLDMKKLIIQEKTTPSNVADITDNDVTEITNSSNTVEIENTNSQV